MSNMKAKPLPQTLKDLLANKSRILSQAQVFEDMGMTETAQPLWLAAASCEERLAPLMESAGMLRRLRFTASVRPPVTQKPWI